MRQFCPKLASEKKRFSVRKKPVDAKLAPNLHLKGPGASPRGWDMRMLHQQGRPKIDLFYLLSTHLTFIIAHANSPNFHQRTGALRMQKWPPRPSKMTQNRPQRQPQITLKRFYQHMHFSLQPPRYAYADLRHEVCGAGIHACVFNINENHWKINEINRNQ